MHCYVSYLPLTCITSIPCWWADDDVLQVFFHGLLPSIFKPPPVMNEYAMSDEEKQIYADVVDEEEQEKEEIKSYGQGWLKLGEFILRPRNGAVILACLFLLITPFAIHASRLRSLPDWRTDIPVHSQSYSTLKALGRLL